MLLKVLLIRFNNALRADTTKMVCEGPFANTAFSGGRLNRQNVLSPSSRFPSDWRKWLVFVHKKATLFGDPNREFLTSTRGAQPVCLLMHQIKIGFLLLMKRCLSKEDITHIKITSFPFPLFLMQKIQKGNSNVTVHFAHGLFYIG